MPEPDGGWRVFDESKATADAMYAAFDLADTLEGYGGSWLDQSPNPADGADLPVEELELRMNDPLLTVVNVRVTGDVAAAEAALREVWGGMLCVSKAQRTEAELSAIVNELFEERPDLVLMGGPNTFAGTADVTVTYDDGALQRQLDEEYGEGLVVVESVLRPVEE